MYSKDKNKKVFSAIFVILIILAIAFMFSKLHALVTDEIIKNSIKSIREVTKHDETSIISNLNQKWNYLEEIANEISSNNLSSIQEVKNQLNISTKILKPIELFLISSDDELFSGNYLDSYTSNNELIELCEKSENHFVFKLKTFSDDSSKNVITTTSGETMPAEVLVVGSKIVPFTVEDKTFEYVVCFYDTDILLNNLEINLYNGRGSSIVVDQQGNYIVSIHRDKDFNDINNFFEAIGEDLFESGISVSEVAEKMSTQETFNIEYAFKGNTFVMVFSPIKSLNWYFVESVPRAIFEDESSNIINIFTILLSFVLVGLVFLIILILKNTSQKKLMHIETMHRKELENALEKAEQASRAKTTFLNNMSHDIRTPMNAIIGFTNLAKTHLKDEEQTKDYLEKISQSSDHLLSLINEVLDMSRIESGKITIEEKEESLAEILHSLSDMIQADVESHNLSLFVDTINITDEFIYCDKLRLNQILINLLANAIKFSKENGSIYLLVSQKENSKPGYGTYEFKVKDNGIGISQDFIKDIFEPFTRERNSTVSGIQGTGLGMAIVKATLDMMGGKIEVQSEVGKGTEFIVTIDFKLQENKELTLPEEKAKGLNCLIIATDINACKGTSDILNKLKIKNKWSNSIKESLALIEKNSFNTFFVEWKMNEIDGIEVTKQIRKIVGNNIPIYLTSVYDFSSIRSEAVNAGVTEFLSKPIFISDIINLLNKHYEFEKSFEETLEKEIDFKGKRILLVEDNFMNREIATEYLTDFGFLVETAENGKIACDILQNSKTGYFDLVLMDIQMPVMNGYEATKTIRAFQNNEIANIPIIATTANVFEEDKNLVQEAGMNGFLAKPINIADLLNVLKKFIKK